MFQGSMVALVTPMHADGAVDWPALADLVEWHIQEGTHAIVAVGTTGESPTLSVSEHMEVIRRVVDIAAKRIPVIAGTGANATSEALEWTATAKGLGADACLLVAPYYNKPTQEGLFLHHEYVAKAVAIPQILYNVPARTAVDIKPETVARLAKVPHIIGLKEATGDMNRLKQLQALLPTDFMLVSGDDATAREFMELGGHGDISVTANVAPKAMAQMCKAALAGNFEQARALDKSLEKLHKTLFLEANPIPVKWALAQMGRCDVGIRLPLTPLSQHHHEAVREALLAANVAIP